MPGYSIVPNANEPILVVDPETLEEIYNKVFYGLRYNPEDGKVTVEVIREDEAISLPETDTYHSYEYAHWFASPKSINFTWKESKKTHLFMEVV